MRSFQSLTVVALASTAVTTPTSGSYIQYSTVPGYFLQDLNSTNATTFSYTATNFGLINQTYPGVDASLSQWQQFQQVVAQLNQAAARNVDYKLLFMGRHGEGYHNAAESYYGTPAWNCYWSLLDGNTTSIWADAHLTTPGIAQALIANGLWQKLISSQNIQVPQSYYTSPLFRCLSTANLTFSGLDLPKKYPFVPTVKEKLREGISEHTCDRRSTLTFIHTSFPTYKIESDFAEYDELWTGTTAEVSAGQDLRSKQVLDDIFSHDCNTYLSFTSHSGEIASLLRVLGHRTFSLSTGAVIPVLVKAETINPGQATTTFAGASATPSPHCTVPPVSSVSGGPNGGCVCPSSAAPVVSLMGGIGTQIVVPSATGT
jgi:broad specificity phosphatase PhoE